MKIKIRNQFLINYCIMFVISIMITICTLILMGFAGDMVSKTLKKNNFTAEKLMQEDYHKIDTGQVIKNGGGIQVINQNYEIVLSDGISTFKKNKLSISEFTKFLTDSKKLGIPYSFDIAYNEKNKFWLVVTFPTSIRIDFYIAHNKEYCSKDSNNVSTVLLAIIIFYLLLLAVSTVIYSKITSLSIVNPLKKLMGFIRKLKEGDYSARTDLQLNNEFGELQSTLNSMAEKIEDEITLRKQSEENRKQLILDISHDLKNPLASILGYAELIYNKKELTKDELNIYVNVIKENSIRANRLIKDLFELSKMDSPEFKLNLSQIDLSEYLREEIAGFLPALEQKNFVYEFEIPDKEIMVSIEREQFSRVIQNLISNTLKYNEPGTRLWIRLYEQNKEAVITIEDSGVGIPKEQGKDIFNPFVRADYSKNSLLEGTGLGLAIVKKIVENHGGTIELESDSGKGCIFTIHIPII